jgi:hypothetical protein
VNFSSLSLAMRKEEKLAALKELARRYPRVKDVGHFWKNPLDPKSRGIRWTKTDLALFLELQKKHR